MSPKAEHPALPGASRCRPPGNQSAIATARQGAGGSGRSGNRVSGRREEPHQINADLGLPDDGPTREILTFLAAVLNRQQSARGCRRRCARLARRRHCRQRCSALLASCPTTGYNLAATSRIAHDGLGPMPLNDSMMKCGPVALCLLLTSAAVRGAETAPALTVIPAPEAAQPARQDGDDRRGQLLPLDTDQELRQLRDSDWPGRSFPRPVEAEADEKRPLPRRLLLSSGDPPVRQLLLAGASHHRWPGRALERDVSACRSMRTIPWPRAWCGPLRRQAPFS